ncbi:MAG: acylphosphatase [Ferruginibacter sp.]
MATIHLIIKGSVQGVFFRKNAREEALSIGVSGWIKNKDNGDVEAMVTGDPEKLVLFEKWCREGPRLAEVDEVIITWCEEKFFEKFIIK